MKKILLTFLAILLLICAPFLGPTIYCKIENQKIRSDIISYVLENKDHIEVTGNSQTFPYATTGLAVAGVEYGYYFNAENQFENKGTPYRSGFRLDGFPDEPTDWYYTERICENWFYYEVHDG